MTLTKLDWPTRPKITEDRLFQQKRRTWKDRESGYVISQCSLPDFTLVYPKYFGKQPTYHRTLKAAMRAAEEHRNGD